MTAAPCHGPTLTVMAGLVPANCAPVGEAWTPGTGPAMTVSLRGQGTQWQTT
jgi:hypothetical protein